MEIVPENVKYPQGAEKMQIKAITNREVKPGGLPSGVGCNVISTQTVSYTHLDVYKRQEQSSGGARGGKARLESDFAVRLLKSSARTF